MQFYKNRRYLESIGFRSCVLLALIVCFAVFASQVPNGNYNHDSDQKSDNVRINDQPEKPILERALDDPSAFSNLIVAGFTAILSVVAISQLFLLFRADKTALRSVEAAIKATAVAERALEGTEGPFINVDASMMLFSRPCRAIDGTVKVEHQGNIKYTIRNHGRSPATITEVYTDWTVSEGIQVPPIVPFPPPKKNIHQITEVAAGECSDFFYINKVNDIGSLVDKKVREKIGWVVFNIRYVDVFGNYFIANLTMFWSVKENKFFTVGGSHNFRRKLTHDEAKTAKKRDSLI